MDEEVVVAPAKDDPKKPWKMLAAVATAVIAYLITQNLVDFPAYVDLILNSGSVGLAVFFVRNPKLRES